MSGDIIVGAAKHGRDWVDYGGIILTFVGVIVVGLYTCYAKKQNELTEKALIYSKRACLIIVGEPAIPAIQPGRLESWAKVKNIGDVPASGLRCEAAFALDRLPMKPTLGDRHSVLNELVICGDEPIIIEHAFNVDVRPEEALAAMNMERQLYFYWLVEYSDCFGKRWRTVKAWHMYQAAGVFGYWEEIAVLGWKPLE